MRHLPVLVIAITAVACAQSTKPNYHTPTPDAMVDIDSSFPIRPDATAYDARPQAVDATPADAAPASCDPGAVISINSQATQSGTSYLYKGTIPYGKGTQAGTCDTFDSSSEQALSFDLPGRARLHITTDIIGTNGLDTVLYVRRDCLDASSELGCNDDVNYDAGDYRSTVDLNDVNGGTIYIFVDTHDFATLPATYGLGVTVTPIVGMGEACDPAGVTAICDPTLVCSLAAGSPTCQASLGGPSVTSVTATLLDNNRTVALDLMAHDPDGDIKTVQLSFLDSAGAVIDPGDGSGGTYSILGANLAGVDVVAQLDELIAVGIDETQVAKVRLVLTDSTNNKSTPVAVNLLRPSYGGAGATCGGPLAGCKGELVCQSSQCVEPTSSTDACTTADAAGAITTSQTLTLNLAPASGDHLQGSCYTMPGFGEDIVKIAVAGPEHAQLTLDSSYSPSAANLDTYVYVRSVCDDPTTELACNDDLDPGFGYYQSYLTIDDLPPGTYYVVVDGSSNLPGRSPTGPVGLDVEFTPLKVFGETCDPFVDTCVPGLSCEDPTGSGTGTCEPPACFSASPITPGTAVTGQIYQFDSSSFDGSCRHDTVNSYAEQTYLLTLTQKSDVVASTDSTATNFDTVLYVLADCKPGATELACNDDVNATNDWRSKLTVTLDPGTYTIVVDMGSPSLPDGSRGTAPDPSSFTLDVTTTPVLASGSACDPAGVANRCDTGLTCTDSGSGPVCQ